MVWQARALFCRSCPQPQKERFAGNMGVAGRRQRHGRGVEISVIIRSTVRIMNYRASSRGSDPICMPPGDCIGQSRSAGVLLRRVFLPIYALDHDQSAAGAVQLGTGLRCLHFPLVYSLSISTSYSYSDSYSDFYSHAPRITLLTYWTM